MRFRIGPHTYSLRITEGPVVFEGSPCVGACLKASREILLAADCPADRRYTALLHELARAWSFETGLPSEPEAWFGLAATMAAAAAVDLNNQGGELALLSLRPGESPEPAAAKIGLTRTRRCGACGGDVAGGDIECRTAGGSTVELRLYCEFCNLTQTWRESQTARGLPSGTVLGEPKVERGDRRQAALVGA